MMRRLAVSLVVATALLTGAAATSPANASRTAQSRCFEDQPCWDCRTMGNRICGPSEVLLIPPAVWERSADGTVTYSEMLAETLPGPFYGWGAP